MSALHQLSAESSDKGVPTMAHDPWLPAELQQARAYGRAFQEILNTVFPDPFDPTPKGPQITGYDEWTVDVDEIELSAEDGFRLLVMQDLRLTCEWVGGAVEITDVSMKIWGRHHPRFVSISARDDELSRAICNAVRREYSDDKGQGWLKEMRGEAVENSRE